MTEIIRLGVIGFINTIPVYHHFQAGGLNVTSIAGSPVQLNAAMASGEMNISPVSSAHYLSNQEHYVLLDNLSVSSYGSVDSVLFLSKKPLHQIGPADTIAVPNDSATSIALLQHILRQETGHDFSTQLITYPASEFKTAYGTHNTVLIIGDRALSAQQWFQSQQAFCTDLSQWWVNRTGLPFVFAVWVANKHWANNHPQWLNTINQNLVLAKEAFFNTPELLQQALTKAKQLSPLSSEEIQHYWQHSLNYDLTENHQASLKQFAMVLEGRTMAPSVKNSQEAVSA